MGTDRLTWFNELPAREAQRVLLECCSARMWTEQMARARPYGAVPDAVRQSSAIVATLNVSDLTEALAGHPRIGERPRTDWSRREQSGLDGDDAQTSRALAEANVQYERRFGHIYLVCATGRTGHELLVLARGRLQNEPEDEWQVVRTELQKINGLRLERLLAGSA